MVGAQVSNTDSGRQLMLYGFVATDFGKDDAVTKSRAYLHDSTIAVVNNIRVNPQLKHMKRPPSDEDASGAMNSGMSPPPRADWENTFDNTLARGRRLAIERSRVEDARPRRSRSGCSWRDVVRSDPYSRMVQFRPPWSTR